MGQQRKRELEKRRMEKSVRVGEMQRKRRRKRRRILVLTEIVIMTVILSFMAYELTGKKDSFSGWGENEQTEKIRELSAVDMDILKEVISNVESIDKEAYTKESVAQLEESISKAETYMKKKKISQEEIGQIYTEVIMRIQQLQVIQ